MIPSWTTHRGNSPVRLRRGIGDTQGGPGGQGKSSKIGKSLYKWFPGWGLGGNKMAKSLIRHLRSFLPYYFFQIYHPMMVFPQFHGIRLLLYRIFFFVMSLVFWTFSFGKKKQKHRSHMAPQAKPLCGNESYMAPLVIRCSQQMYFWHWTSPKTMVLRVFYKSFSILFETSCFSF